MISLSKNLENHLRTKYINIQYYYFWETKINNIININNQPSKKMIVYKLTKVLIISKMKIFIKEFKFFKLKNYNNYIFLYFSKNMQ